MMRLLSVGIISTLLSVLFLLTFACGDDDDDNDDNDDWSSDDDAASDDDDDNPPPEGCQAYADAFFGEGGCFPEETIYQNTLQFCGDLLASGNPYVENFYNCLAGIDCAQFTDALELWAAIEECLNQLPSD